MRNQSWQFLLPTLLLALAIAIVGAPTPAFAEGQAQAAAGSRIADLQLGHVLFGPTEAPAELLGKVVVVNIGGG
ncbi:MAG: hypothetical protein AAF581_06840 [Planctomycetota bacterium]